MQRKYIDLSGKRFGRWFVIERTPNVRPGMTMWKCRCDCGKIKDHVMYAALVRGSSNSCGCLRSDMLMKPDHLTHSQRNPLWTLWQSIKTRCFNANHPSFKSYGARGIVMCEEWRNSFDTFVVDVGKRPEGSSLDRIDNDKGYFKENCRWASKCEQAGNTRRNIRVTWKGWECNLIDVARAENVNYASLNVAFRNGKNLETAVSDLRARGSIFYERAKTMGGTGLPKTDKRRRTCKPENLPKIDKRYKHFASEKGAPTRETPIYLIPEPGYGTAKPRTPKKKTGFKGKFNTSSAKDRRLWKAHAWCKEKGITYHGDLPDNWDWNKHSR